MRIPVNRLIALAFSVEISLLAGAIPATAAPAITAVDNAASNIPPGLPNAGIAQGAIFSVYGSGLGPANLVIATSPFQLTTLSGTSVSVTVGTTSVDALMYYTSAGQVAALLPSNTPTGTGTITVTYNGASAQSPITVVANNLGIFTIDSTGGGPAIVTYPDYSLVSPVKASNCGGPGTTCGAANPGDALILWATGLGPASSDGAAGLGQPMPDIPLKLWLGGVQIKPSYQGRSGCCVGEDQIVFTVPTNVPTGCAVPLLVQIGDQISNNTLIPVANGTRACPLVSPTFSSLNAQQIEQLVIAGPIAFADIGLAHNSQGGGAFADVARFQFLKATSYVPGTQPFFVSWIDDPPLNACIVFNNTNPGFNVPFAAKSPLDAGPSFTVTGPNGSMTVPANGGKRDKLNTTGAFVTPGTYTITGDGGADVRAVNASITIPAAATLTSPANNGTATRANEMTITWSGGSGNVRIYVNSCLDSACNNGAVAVCDAPASLGTFNIPPYILQALPAGNFAGVVLDSYSSASFSATGLDAGTVATHSDLGGFGAFWGSGAFTFE